MNILGLPFHNVFSGGSISLAEPVLNPTRVVSISDRIVRDPVIDLHVGSSFRLESKGDQNLKISDLVLQILKPS